jgi:uncharacterized protein (DUF2267 family)
MTEKQTIVELVSEKAGISEEQAQVAVTTVVTFMKDRLPDPIAGQIDGLLTQDVSGVAGHVDELLKGGLGGLLGGKK